MAIAQAFIGSYRFSSSNSAGDGIGDRDKLLSDCINNLTD